MSADVRHRVRTCLRYGWRPLGSNGPVPTHGLIGSDTSEVTYCARDTPLDTSVTFGWPVDNCLRAAGAGC